MDTTAKDIRQEAERIIERCKRIGDEFEAALEEHRRLVDSMSVSKPWLPD